MAEVVAGAGALLVAEQVISTTVEAGAAGYMVTKPTNVLKATYNMIATAGDDESPRSLGPRANHTLTVIANKAYIFGGDTNEGVASNDVHVVRLASSEKHEPDYHMIPVLPSVEAGKLPEPRTQHAACAFRGRLAVYGGCDAQGEIIKEGSTIWIFDPESTTWSELPGTTSGFGPGPRCNSKIFANGNTLVLYGGNSRISGTQSDVWLFNADTETWTQLPTAPVWTTNAALAGSQLYLISGSDPMSSELHHLDTSKADKEVTWRTITFPTNPIAPGPRARQGGGLLPITTGYGRNFLVYFLGAREDIAEKAAPAEDESYEVTQWSDMWTLQLPSSVLEAKAKMSIGEAIKPAIIKDKIRSAFGADSGLHSWAEVEVNLPADLPLPDGKLHPGPRGSFGCDVMEDGRSVVLWGGENAKGERVGDGWVIKLE